MYIDEDGVVNASEAMIKQARKDFVKGAKILYSVYHHIPTQKEALKDPIRWRKVTSDDVRWCYDAWRFVIEDPYDMFSDVGSEAVIDSWSKDAKAESFKEDYISGKILEMLITKGKIKQDDFRCSEIVDKYNEAIRYLNKLHRTNLKTAWDKTAKNRFADKNYPIKIS